MKTMLAVMFLMGVAWSQQTSTTITTSDGTQLTATCMVGDIHTNCTVRNTTPTWKEIRQAQHAEYLDKHPEKAKKEREKRERAECKKDHDAHAWCSLYDAK